MVPSIDPGRLAASDMLKIERSRWTLVLVDALGVLVNGLLARAVDERQEWDQLVIRVCSLSARRRWKVANLLGRDQ
jgi:adenosyl cobinamide kinase/adenosyl cobinamide phosphate guanylyltransferase